MAHIQINRDGGVRLMVNGLDLTGHTYSDGVQLVVVGDEESGEAAIQITLAISRLDVGANEDIDVTLLFAMLEGGSL